MINMNDTMQESKLQRFVEHFEETDISFAADLLNLAERVIENSQFPTSRNEAWKYTRLGKLQNLVLYPNTSATTPFIQPIHEDSLQFVFDNGKLVQGDFENLPEGLNVKLLSLCSTEEISNYAGQLLKADSDIFSAMNTLYARDGLLIHAASKSVLDQTIEVVHIVSGENTVSHWRNIIIAEKFSQFNVIHRYLSTSKEKSFTNSVSEIFVEEGAHLTLDKIQYEGSHALSIVNEVVRQAKDSTFKINTFSLSGLLLRNNLTIEVAGSNCTTHLNGAYLLKESQHVDNHTIVDHLAPDCNSFELYKGVMDDNSTAVFNGKVYVRKDSQRINAFQSNANVLLSNSATVNSKPELEIYADDVKCSHGSTTGQLDEEAVFYLRSRGISEKSARQLLVSAFIGDVLAKVDDELVHTHITDLIKTEFGWDLV